MNNNGIESSPFKLRPGRGWYGVAVALFLVFSVLSLIVLYFILTMAPVERVFFLTPGKQAIRVDTAGPHTLVYEARTVYAGTAFDTPMRLPAGTHVAITNLATGRAVPIRIDLGHPLIRFGLSRNRIGRCAIESPGHYEITLRMPEDDDLRRVFSFGPSQFWMVVGWLSLWTLVSFMAFFFGPALAILVYARRMASKRRRGLC